MKLCDISRRPYCTIYFFFYFVFLQKSPVHRFEVKAYFCDADKKNTVSLQLTVFIFHDTWRREKTVNPFSYALFFLYFISFLMS